MKKNLKKAMKKMSFMLNKEVIAEINADPTGAAEVVTKVAQKIESYKLFVPEVGAKDDNGTWVPAIDADGNKKIAVDHWLKMRKFTDAMQEMEDLHIKACETGDKQGLAAIYNYIAACVKQIGIVITGTGWIHSLGTYAKMCKEEGIEDIKAFVAAMPKDAVNRPNHVAYDIFFCLNHITAVEREDYSNEYAPYVSKVPQKITRWGIREKVCNSADQISDIFAGIILHWRGAKSTPEDVMAIADDLAAVVCFISEATIDATKKLPINSIDLPFFTRLSSVKMYHKLQEGEIVLMGGGNQGKMGVLASFYPNKESQFKLDSNGGPAKVKTYDRRKRKMLKTEDFFSAEHEKGINIVEFRDHAFLAEHPLFEYAQEKAKWALKVIEQARMPQEIIQKWIAVAKAHQGVFSVFNSMKQHRQTIISAFLAECKKNMIYMGGESSDVYKAWEEAEASVKSQLLKHLINTMRYAYQIDGVSALDAGRIALAIQYMTQSEEREDDTGVADFALGTIDAEAVLALLTDLNDKVEFKGKIEHKLNVLDESVIADYIDKEVEFKNGMFAVNNEVVAEFVGDHHTATETVSGTFIIKETVDEDGELAYFGTTDLLAAIQKDIEANYAFDINDGILVQLQAMTGTTAKQAQDYISRIATKSKGKQVTLVPYNKSTGFKNALVVENKVIGNFKCGGNSTNPKDKQLQNEALSFWNKLYSNKKGTIRLAKAINYSQENSGEMITGLFVLGNISDGIIDDSVELINDVPVIEKPSPEELKAKFFARMGKSPLKPIMSKLVEETKVPETKKPGLKEKKAMVKKIAELQATEVKSLKEKKAIVKKIAELQEYFTANGTIDGFDNK